MLTNVVSYFLLTFLYRGSFLKKVIAVFISYAVSLCIDAFLVSIEYIMDDKNIIISSGIATSFLIDENIGKPFHSEYIISGLLMNVIAISDKYDGVAYFSKKFSDKKESYPINVCFALLAKFNNKKYTRDIENIKWTNPMPLRDYSMINWNARYDEVIIGDVEEEEKEKRSLTLIGDGVAYCDTLMYGFDKWIIEKMDFTKGVNEKLK